MNWVEPSRYDRKRTPSSSIERIAPERSPANCAARPLISSATVPCPIENTWKPPESVMIGAVPALEGVQPAELGDQVGTPA